MKVTICDRCRSRVGMGGGVVTIVEPARTEGLTGEWDLCDECLNEVATLLTNPKDPR